MNKLIYGPNLQSPEPLQLVDAKEAMRTGQLVKINDSIFLEGKPLEIKIAIQVNSQSQNGILCIKLLGKQGHKLATFLREIDRRWCDRGIVFQHNTRDRREWNGSFGQGSCLAGLYLSVVQCRDPVLGRIDLIQGKCLATLTHHRGWVASLEFNDPKRLAINCLARGLDHLGWRLPNFVFWKIYCLLKSG